MFYLECQCKFRNVWNEVENLAPYPDLRSAVAAAVRISIQRRTPVRIVDDYGQVVWE